MQDRIGFRTIAVRGADLLLNGRPIFLRGIALHEEALVRGGRATTRADAEALLGLARELGCNFVRLAHYPHNDEMTRAADRLGLLVWSEIPVYWTIAWTNAATLANARQQLAEMIARDQNRASVILWSVANETPITDARTRFLRRLVDDAHAADPTRLVTAALEHHYAKNGDGDGGAGAATVIVDDPLGAALDVLGLNEYVGWYDGLPEKCDRLTWRTAYQKPLVVSELGADAKAGLHGDDAHPLHRGVPGQLLSPPAGDAADDPDAARDVALDPRRFPLAATAAARRAGRLEPQGAGRQRRHQEAGVLDPARRLSRPRAPGAPTGAP